MISRRQHIKTLGKLGAILPLMNPVPWNHTFSHARHIKHDIHIFSKHLQWLDVEAMAAIAARTGFDGVDLTVRAKGHVLPENVINDLPKALEAIRKAGLKTELLTTAITNVEDPHTEAILKAASQQGIKTYRMGWLQYIPGISIPVQLDKFKKQFGELAEMNKHYGIQAAYQNHAGTGLGASLWDIWHVVKDLDPRYLGIQFDVRHAMVESYSSWALGLKLLAPHINSLDIKDFKWSAINGKLILDNVPLGQGIVDFEKYFTMLDDLNIKAPFCLHLEYPLGGANDGEHKLTVPESVVTEAMKTDLKRLRNLLGKT